MKRFLFILPIVFFSVYSCGPAAEERSQMHARAKTIADSMANLIKVAMAEAEMPGGQQVMVAPTPPPTTSATPNNTVQPPKK